MQLTKHATARCQQRAIAPLMIDLLLQFGQTESAGAGATKFFFDKTARRRVASYAGPLASLLTDHLDLFAVVDDDMQVITVGHRLERIRRH